MSEGDQPTDVTDRTNSAAAIGPEETASASLGSILEAVAATQPLIQSLVNRVTTNDVANLTLHWGALPVMADAPGEAAEMAETANALLYHTSPMSDTRIEAIRETAAVAEHRGIPMVLDPIGAGATPTRNAVLSELLTEHRFAVIKGNYGEISALAGEDAIVRGVESVGEYEQIAETARSLARETGAIVVASGTADVVANADRAYQITAGHKLLGEVVGTGCMLGASVASFCGALDDPLIGSVYAALAYGLAGELAADADYGGPASYKTALLDSAWRLDSDGVGELALDDRIERI
nr:hydroxyethylthiazole kinase [Halalkalirubrum salinum]